MTVTETIPDRWHAKGQREETKQDRDKPVPPPLSGRRHPRYQPHPGRPECEVAPETDTGRTVHPTQRGSSWSQRSWSDVRNVDDPAVQRQQKHVYRGNSQEPPPTRLHRVSEWNTLVKAAPLGVTVCRPSADSPLGTAALQVAPAIGAGNSVVLQPAKTTPVTASILTDIVAESDVPAAGFAFVPEPTSVATESLTAHEAVAAILQSGPDRAVGQTETAQGTVRLRMTLGGTAPAVVLDDADIEAAAEAIANGGARRRGYRSPGTPSVLAHEAVTDELVTRLDTHLAQWHRGDLFDEATTVGPLVDRERATRVAELVTDAVDRGGRLVRGGEADGRAFEPTLLADVPRDAKVHHERTGPVVAVTAVDSQDAAAAVLNGTARSRAPSVFTDSYDRAMTFADAVETRAVRINAAPDRGPQGGVLGTTVSNSHGLHETLACLTRRKRVIH